MKRLIKKAYQQLDNLQVGDYVFFKNNKTDVLPYKIINILNNNTLVLENETGVWHGIKPSTVQKIKVDEFGNNDKEWQ